VRDPTPDTADDLPGAVRSATDTIGVLALICRRLPRCPDPDPSLTW
jgi:hypothetical protein